MDVDRDRVLTGLAIKKVAEYVIDGAPVAQVRHSFSVRNGKARAYYKSKKFTTGKTRAQNQIRLQLVTKPENRYVPKDVPIQVRLLYIFPRPKRLKTKKSEPGYIPHSVKPDIDNLDKLYLDCLSGIAINDDNQIYKIESCKVFCSYDYSTKSEGWIGTKIQIHMTDDAKSNQLIEKYLPW